MKIIKFEIKKLWRQRKLLLLILIISLLSSGVFIFNASKQSMTADRALQKIQPFIEEKDRIERGLRESLKKEPTDEMQEKQLEYIQEMGLQFVHWRRAIEQKQWGNVPIQEKEFLRILEEFTNNGGEFKPLEGLEREIAIKKNDWLIEHELEYEDEVYPISPHLNLKKISDNLFNIGGLLVFLMLFGNILTIEKEQHTWLTLRTQPVSAWKYIVSKYFSSLLIMIFSLILIVVLGLFIPFIFGEHRISFQFPQILISGESFVVISTFEYLLRSIVLFFCASLFTFSLVFLLSKWAKSSFIVLILTGFIFIIGYMITDIFAILQSFWNPFQFFRFKEIPTAIPQNTDWLYILFAFIWSLLLITFSIILPERESSLFQSLENKKPFNGGKTLGNNHSLWSITIFEWRKIKRRGLLKQLVILLFLLSIFGHFVITQQAKENEIAYLNRLKEVSKFTELYAPLHNETIEMLEEEIKIAKEANDETLAKVYSGQIALENEAFAFVQQKEKKAIAAIEGYKRGEWLPLYEYQLFENRFYNEEFETGNIDAKSFKDSLGEYTIDVSIAEKHWLMEHDIRPVLAGEFQLTILNKLSDEKIGEWKENNKKIDNSGLFSLYYYFENYIYFGPMMIFLFLLGGGFASEKGKKNTLYFLKTQPVHEKHIYLAKVINAIYGSVLGCTVIFLFTVLVGTLFNRFGDWDYPILFYDHPNIVKSIEYTGTKSMNGYGFHFIPLGQYIVVTVGLFLLCFLLLLVFTNFLSVFLKNQLTIFTTTVLIGLGGYYISVEKFPEISHLSPFTYFNLVRVMNGELSILLDNPGINIYTGSLVLVTSALIVLMSGYLLLINRNLQKS